MTNELYEKHCWALVDLDAMQGNLALIQKTVGAPVCCVVKADAYGHGAAVAGPWLEENGAAAFAVSCLAEARHLRRHGISKPILILGYTDPLQVDQLAFNCITQTVYSEEYAKALSAAAQNAGVEVHCHFKVDTGMGRIGSTASKSAAFSKTIRLERAASSAPSLLGTASVIVGASPIRISLPPALAKVFKRSIVVLRSVSQPGMITAS